MNTNFHVRRYNTIQDIFNYINIMTSWCLVLYLSAAGTAVGSTDGAAGVRPGPVQVLERRGQTGQHRLLQPGRVLRPGRVNQPEFRQGGLLLLLILFILLL